MSTLFQKPVQTTSAGKIVGVAALGFATIAMLALVWWSLSPIIGRIYAGIRLAETAFLWKFTGWGTYFTTMPAGQPFSFVSIYKSSVPFGLAATLFTALLGYLAWRKRSREHIEVLITEPAAGFSQQAILDIYAPPECLVRQPVAEPEAVDPVAPVAVNPFKDLRDLRDARAVEAVAESVPWHLAAALYLTIDAGAPLKDRKGRGAVLKAAWKAADRFAADPAAEQPAAVLSTLRSHMVWAIADLTGRSMPALDEVHDVLSSEDNLEGAIARLASRALSERALFFPDYAWLRHVDPTLQSAITSYG